MKVVRATAEAFRSLQGLTLEPGPGLNLLTGPNGSGKTNLVESIYFALTSKSFRTSDRRDLIPFGEQVGRSRCNVEGDDGVNHEFFSSVSRTEGSRHLLDGAGVSLAEARSHRPLILVFAPDRLETIKGPPAVRRAHLDAFVAARWPRRAEARSEFGRTLAQRNALLSRIAAGQSSADQLGAWDQSFSETGAGLVQARSEAVTELAGRFEELTAGLGLEGGTELSYRTATLDGAQAIAAGLSERREADLKAGRTTWGPQQDELRLALDGRQLRRFGSQGQQRIGLLALLLAERQALRDSGLPLPLLILDDALSELDSGRRGNLLSTVSDGGQVLVTAAEEELVPTDQVAEVFEVPVLIGQGRPE